MIERLLGWIRCKAGVHTPVWTIGVVTSVCIQIPYKQMELRVVWCGPCAYCDEMIARDVTGSALDPAQLEV